MISYDMILYYIIFYYILQYSLPKRGIFPALFDCQGAFIRILRTCKCWDMERNR